MRILIGAVGRMKAGPERSLFDRYLSRAEAMGRNIGLSPFSVHEVTESRAGAADTRKAEEMKTLLAGLPEGAVLVALDEGGKQMGSEALANWIGQRRDAGQAAMAFVIGGADGLDKALRVRADLVLSFSPLTWPHQLVRIMLGEQLYRTTTLLAGHPYHRA